MRQQEGQAMADELLVHRQTILDRLADVKRLVPGVVAGYRQRLRDRVAQAFAENNVALRHDDLIREVAVFAERSDVAEEVMRTAPCPVLTVRDRVAQQAPAHLGEELART